LSLTVEFVIVSRPPMNWIPPPGLAVWVGAALLAWFPVMALSEMARVSTEA
jgi:hypothetical protein